MANIGVDKWNERIWQWRWKFLEFSEAIGNIISQRRRKKPQKQPEAQYEQEKKSVAPHQKRMQDQKQNTREPESLGEDRGKRDFIIFTRRYRGNPTILIPCSLSRSVSSAGPAPASGDRWS